MSPCSILYGYLGIELAKSVTKENPYYEWISFYNSSKYQEEVKVLDSLVNYWGDGITVENPVMNTLMNLYTTAMQYEYEFFDIVYQ
jgi:thiaminase